MAGGSDVGNRSFEIQDVRHEDHQDLSEKGVESISDSEKAPELSAMRLM